MASNENQELNELKQDISGKAFEDLTVAEMSDLQGAGDVNGETVTILVGVGVASQVVGAVSAAWDIAKTVQGKC